MKLSENFTLEELTASSSAKRHGLTNIPKPEQLERLKKLCIEILQPIRDSWEKPIKINSGFRSQALNKLLGGARNSQHLKGEAADITSDDNHKLWNVIISLIKEGKISVGQLIDEKNLSWIHISLCDARHQNQILSLK